ncbi:MAG: ABC transporter permease, partial [Bacteroidota bacterium]
DFRAYRSFKDQAEDYRYKLAQTMNELQMEFISNNVASSADKHAVLDQKHWHDFPDFQPTPVSLAMSLSSAWRGLLSLALWAFGLTALALFIHRPANVI